MCAQEENQEFICSALDIQSYQALVAVLILDDVQVLLVNFLQRRVNVKKKFAIGGKITTKFFATNI
jgi:hypothetical protein